MFEQHLPLLPVIIPLLGAAFVILIPNRQIVWGIATLLSGFAFLCALSLLEMVMAQGELRYALGGWSPPWGIEMRVDTASAFILTAVTAISTLVLIYANRSAIKEIPSSHLSLYYTAHLLCLAGLSGILLTGDAFNLFVFLEISSLATYTLVSLGSDKRALTAAFRYLVMGTIGATFILIGVGLLYMKTGTLNMIDLGSRIDAIEGSKTINTGLAFIMVGVSIKLALFPLHMWLPSAYTFAPSSVTAFLAGTATKVAIYVMLRFVFSIFDSSHVFNAIGMDFILVLLAIIGIFKCSFTAALQSNVKTLLAYSSVAQVGYIVLGIGLVSITGLTASLLHIFNHALMKAALFMAVGAVFYRIGSVHISAFQGLGKHMPWTMGAFTLAGLSIIGVPLTVGFISKWYLVTAAIEQNNWIVAFAVLLGSLLAIIYIGRVLEQAYFQPLPDDRQGVKDAPLLMLVPMWILVIANIYFGIDTSFTVEAASSGASYLLEGVQ